MAFGEDPIPQSARFFSRRNRRKNLWSDYARAGFPMLPVIEPDGRSTARQAVLYCCALLPVSLAPTLLGMATTAYFGGALVLGLLFLALTMKFARTRAVRDARRLFFGSIIYLPILWILMIVFRA